ncbi:MAG: hypothetical protein IH855_00035 [Bacteroidetes bacterium]|nr:hypothetical protein [Bacteroidota bacterium]
MFRFDSFHMYGIIGSAVAVAALWIWIIKKLNLTTVRGEPIRLSPKVWGDSRILGACPGPLFALIGGGIRKQGFRRRGASRGYPARPLRLHGQARPWCALRPDEQDF